MNWIDAASRTTADAGGSKRAGLDSRRGEPIRTRLPVTVEAPWPGSRAGRRRRGACGFSGDVASSKTPATRRFLANGCSFRDAVRDRLVATPSGPAAPRTSRRDRALRGTHMGGDAMHSFERYSRQEGGGDLRPRLWHLGGRRSAARTGQGPLAHGAGAGDRSGLSRGRRPRDRRPRDRRPGIDVPAIRRRRRRDRPGETPDPTYVRPAGRQAMDMPPAAWSKTDEEADESASPPPIRPAITEPGGSPQAIADCQPSRSAVCMGGCRGPGANTRAEFAARTKGRWVSTVRQPSPPQAGSALDQRACQSVPAGGANSGSGTLATGRSSPRVTSSNRSSPPRSSKNRRRAGASTDR